MYNCVTILEIEIEIKIEYIQHRINLHFTKDKEFLKIVSAWLICCQHFVTSQFTELRVLSFKPT